jgi:hypothetical protein
VLGFAPTEATVYAAADGIHGRCWVGAKARRWNTLEAIQDDLTWRLAGRIGVAIAKGGDWRALSPAMILELETFAEEHDRRDYDRAAARLLGSDFLLPGCHWMDRALPKAAARAARILTEYWREVSTIAHELDRDGRYEGARYGVFAET